MNTLIFAGGILCGALATFVFVFLTITFASASSKKKKDNKPIISDDVIMRLYEKYLEKMKDEGK